MPQPAVAVTVEVMDWDDDLARQVEGALLGSCTHPLAALDVTGDGFVCRSCGGSWGDDIAGGLTEVLHVLLGSLRREQDQTNARLQRLEETLGRRLGAVACPGCGVFLTRNEGVRLGAGVRSCIQHVVHAVWEHPEHHLGAIVEWVHDSGVRRSRRFAERCVFETLLAGVPALRELLGEDAEPHEDRFKLPPDMVERLGITRTARLDEIAAAAAVLFDVAIPRTSSGAAQLLAVVSAASSNRGDVQADDPDARWARIASQAWMPNPASRAVAFADLYRDVLDGERFDPGFVDDALAVLTQRGAELLLTAPPV